MQFRVPNHRYIFYFVYRMSAAVTEEIVTNLIKSNLSHLKSFAEMLNAEFTEEGQDQENREKFKDDVSRVLDKFGSAEADFQKSLSVLTNTKNELINADDNVVEEDCNPQALMKEVDDIINIFEGKARSNEAEPAFGEFDENRIVDQLEKVEDILNEFNPMKFRDDDDAEDEEANEVEEERMCKVLELFQKKHMKKHEASMVAEGDDDEDAMEVDNADEDTTEDEEEPENEPDNQRPGGSNSKAKKEMDTKLKAMWNNYQKEISNVQLKSLKEIYDKKLSETATLPKDRMTHYSKFNKSILELFSHEAIVVCGGKENYIDPFTKQAIQHPIRNKQCGHIYEKDVVSNMLKKKKAMGCPNVGCAVKFTSYDLEEDEELTQKVTQSLNERQSSQPSTSANVSNAEYLDDDETDDEYE